PNTFAGRNTGVGLAGTWGTLFYGFWDTPYKYPLTLIGPIRGAEPFDNGMIANPGFNVPPTTSQTGRVPNGTTPATALNANAAFHRHQADRGVRGPELQRRRHRPPRHQALRPHRLVGHPPAEVRRPPALRRVRHGHGGQLQPGRGRRLHDDRPRLQAVQLRLRLQPQ